MDETQAVLETSNFPIISGSGSDPLVVVMDNSLGSRKSLIIRHGGCLLSRPVLNAL